MDRLACRVEKKNQGETMLIWIGIAWLLCAAVFLELISRAPAIDS